MADRNGIVKVRPVVVVSSEADIAAGKRVVVVAVSSTFSEPLRPACVRLPWAAGKHRRTGLEKPSVAVADWWEMKDPDEIGAPIGILTAAALDQLMETLDRLGVPRSAP